MKLVLLGINRHLGLLCGTISSFSEHHWLSRVRFAELLIPTFSCWQGSIHLWSVHTRNPASASFRSTYLVKRMVKFWETRRKLKMFETIKLLLQIKRYIYSYCDNTILIYNMLLSVECHELFLWKEILWLF